MAGFLYPRMICAPFRILSTVKSMNILMPYKTHTDVLRTVRSILEPRGHTCVPYPVETSARTAEAVKASTYDAVIAVESAALSGVPERMRTIYLSADFFCPERKMPAVETCLIAHEELSFDFITHGVRDKSISVCGIPLRESLRRKLPQAECRRALGLRTDVPVFMMVGDTVAISVLKSAVRAVRTFSAQTQTILVGSNEARRRSWMFAFAEDPNVFVSDVEMHCALALCASDAVITPGLPVFVCAAARQEKIITLLHSTVPRAKKNAAFLHAHGAVFGGMTAADSVSYACRLLENDRLYRKMTDAQQKTVLADAEDRLIRAVEL